MSEWTVYLVFLSLTVAGAILGVRLAIMRHPIWLVLLPVEVVLAVVGCFLAAPRPAPVPVGSPLADFGGGADFAREWSAHRVLYGTPIGTCAVRRGVLTCPTRYYFLEWHPANPAGWRFLNANLGLELMALRAVPEEASPRLPPHVLAYLADQQARGVDMLRFFGYPRTSPQPWGERLLVYFDKAVLAWPAGADDPAAIERLPLGEIFWAREFRGDDPTTPVVWTPARLLLAALGVVLLGGVGAYAYLTGRVPRYAL